MKEQLSVRVTDIIGSSLCVSADDGQLVFDKIAPLMRDGKKIILHLTPITTDVEDLDSNGNIKMTSFGEDALQLGLPKVKVRQMSTMVEVENGEMLVIGGLIDSAEGKTGSFAPGVGSIPIVRYLFGVEEKTMQKRELVILLTPRII